MVVMSQRGDDKMSFFTRTATHPTTPPASADPATPGTITPNKPGEVLWLDGKQAEVLDIDDPPSSLMVALSTQQIACDAYVFTDRGVHLYYIKPNAPTEDIKSLYFVVCINPARSYS
jgi:hypothetical protein